MKISHPLERGVRIALLSTAASCALAGAAPALSQESAAATAAVDTSGAAPTDELREIVVTARKRGAESLQRTPVAITAIDIGTVRQAQATSLVDIGRLAPNVQFQTAGTFPGIANFTIRGMTYNNSLRSLDPTVAIVIDGLPLGDLRGSILDTFGVESIEILRGPQGVLVGKNATGGAVNIRSRRPGTVFHLEAETRIGNGNRFDQSLLVEGPLSETLSANIALLHRKSDGLSKDRNGGRLVPAPANPSGTVNDQFRGSEVREDTFIVRPIVSWQPSANFNATLIGEYIDATFGGNNARVIAPKPVLSTQLGYTPPLNGYEINVAYPGRARTKTYRANLEMNLVTPIGTLTSVSAYRDVDDFNHIATDGTPFTLVDFPGLKYTGDQFVQEVRLNSDVTDNVKLLAGVFYSDTHMFSIEDRILRLAPPLFLPVYQKNDWTQNAEVAAGYANLDWTIAEGLSLSGGLRYTYETKDIDSRPYAACAGPGFTNCPNARVAIKKSWDDVSPRAAINYQANSDLLVYGSWTKGFRSGNFNGRAAAIAGVGPSDPETASSFEAGVKSTAFDRKLRVNFAAYYTKYKGIQKVLTLSNAVQSIVNAADATIYGGELEINALPLPGLQLDGAFGYTNASFDRFDGLDLTGDRVPDPGLAKELKFERVPETTATVAANYSFSLGLPGRFTARTSYAWRSSFFVDLLNTRTMKVPSYGLWDASLAFDYNERLRVSVYGKNLSNTHYWDTGVDYTFGATVWGGEPRSYGVTLGYRL